MISEKLANELKSLTNQENEICGYAFANEDGDKIRVKIANLTGEGNPGKVKDDTNKLENVQKYLDKHPEDIPVIFHTHSEGTRKNYLPKYMYEFSEADEENMKRNLEGVFMLVTPETIIARKGKESLEVIVA